MSTLSLTPFPAYHREVKRIHLRFNLDPVFPSLARTIRRRRHLYHNSLMSCVKCSFIRQFNLLKVAADHLGGEIERNCTLKAFPAFREREFYQCLPVKIENIKDNRHHLNST